jgi:hypothetical protein
VSLSPEQRTLRAQIAAHTRWSRERDRAAATRAGREKFDKRFYDQVDPDRELDPVLRDKLAANARQAYFRTLALRSSRSRAAKAGASS